MAAQQRNELENDSCSKDKVLHGNLEDKDRYSIDEIEGHVAVEQNSFSEEDKKRILRKVDLRVVPLLSFLYLVSFIDRGNRERIHPFQTQRLSR